MAVRVLWLACVRVLWRACFVRACVRVQHTLQLLPNRNFEKTAHEPILDGRFRVVTNVEDWTPGNVRAHEPGRSRVAPCTPSLKSGFQIVWLPTPHFASCLKPLFTFCAIQNKKFCVVWFSVKVCISNYGFGGTNAFAVLGPCPQTNEATGLSSFRLAPSWQAPPVLAVPPGPAALAPKFSNSPGTDFSQVDPTWLKIQAALGNDAAYR